MDAFKRTRSGARAGCFIDLWQMQIRRPKSKGRKKDEERNPKFELLLWVCAAIHGNSRCRLQVRVNLSKALLARTGQLAFSFEPQLAAGGIDIVAFLAAERRRDVLFG